MAPRLRIARLAQEGRPFYALLDEADDRTVRTLACDPFAGGDPDAWLRAAGAPRSAPGLRWLTPCAPSKIVCVGRNFHAHIAEMGSEPPAEPLLFLKPPSALLPHRGAIHLPPESRRVDYEGELGIVIGREARRVGEARALDHVLGYTCVNDVTARDLQKRDIQFTRAKGFDTFCPLGPCLATGLLPDEMEIETRVNGERRQGAPIARMIFGVARLVSYVSQVMTLLPGDVIACGTPEGVGPLAAGDEVSVEISGIGALVNSVAVAAG